MMPRSNFGLSSPASDDSSADSEDAGLLFLSVEKVRDSTKDSGDNDELKASASTPSSVHSLSRLLETLNDEDGDTLLNIVRAEENLEGLSKMEAETMTSGLTGWTTNVSKGVPTPQGTPLRNANYCIGEEKIGTLNDEDGDIMRNIVKAEEALEGLSKMEAETITSGLTGWTTNVSRGVPTPQGTPIRKANNCAGEDSISEKEPPEPTTTINDKEGPSLAPIGNTARGAPPLTKESDNGKVSTSYVENCPEPPTVTNDHISRLLKKKKDSTSGVEDSSQSGDHGYVRRNVVMPSPPPFPRHALNGSSPPQIPRPSPPTAGNAQTGAFGQAGAFRISNATYMPGFVPGMVAVPDEEDVNYSVVSPITTPTFRQNTEPIVTATPISPGDDRDAEKGKAEITETMSSCWIYVCGRHIHLGYMLAFLFTLGCLLVAVSAVMVLISGSAEASRTNLNPQAIEPPLQNSASTLNGDSALTTGDTSLGSAINGTPETGAPTARPSHKPSLAPSPDPTSSPSNTPTGSPTKQPTLRPTSSPTAFVDPTFSPTGVMVYYGPLMSVAANDLHIVLGGPQHYRSAMNDEYQDSAKHRGFQFAISEDGRHIHMHGNSWKAFPFNYAVEWNTVVEFDFRLHEETEIQAICLDNDLYAASDPKDPSSPVDRCFQLAGTQASPNWRNRFKSPSIGPKHHYRIELGKYFSGTVNFLCFINDSDDRPELGKASFSDFIIYNDPYMKMTDASAKSVKESTGAIGISKGEIIIVIALVFSFVLASVVGYRMYHGHGFKFPQQYDGNSTIVS